MSLDKNKSQIDSYLKTASDTQPSMASIFAELVKLKS